MEILHRHAAQANIQVQLSTPMKKNVELSCIKRARLDRQFHFDMGHAADNSTLFKGYILKVTLMLKLCMKMSTLCNHKLYISFISCHLKNTVRDTNGT